MCVHRFQLATINRTFNNTDISVAHWYDMKRLSSGSNIGTSQESLAIYTAHNWLNDFYMKCYSWSDLAELEKEFQILTIGMQSVNPLRTGRTLNS